MGKRAVSQPLTVLPRRHDGLRLDHRWRLSPNPPTHAAPKLPLGKKRKSNHSLLHICIKQANSRTPQTNKAKHLANLQQNHVRDSVRKARPAAPRLRRLYDSQGPLQQNSPLRALRGQRAGEGVLLQRFATTWQAGATEEDCAG